MLDLKLKTIGYELLSRSSLPRNGEQDDVTQSTATILANVISEIGIDTVVGAVPAWIEFSFHYLLAELPIPLGPKALILQIPRSERTPERVLARIQNLKYQGYRIVVDCRQAPGAVGPLLGLANVVKLDAAAWNEEQRAELAKSCLRRSVQLLATDVATHKDYELLRNEGFTLFQGSFLCEPEYLQHRRAPANRVALMRLLSELYAEDPVIDRIQQLVQQDIALSYRLLKWLNSSLFALPRPVESIHHALVLLGLQRVRDLVSLVVLARIEDKPSALIETALMRARIGEQVARNIGLVSESMFTVGLFSVLDALVGMPMQEVLVNLPLAQEVAIAIAHREGPYGRVLLGIEAHERGDWNGVERAGLDLSVLSPAWMDALMWVRSVRALLAPGRASERQLTTAKMVR